MRHNSSLFDCNVVFFTIVDQKFRLGTNRYVQNPALKKWTHPKALRNVVQKWVYSKQFLKMTYRTFVEAYRRFKCFAKVNHIGPVFAIPTMTLVLFVTLGYHKTELDVENWTWIYLWYIHTTVSLYNTAYIIS